MRYEDNSQAGGIAQGQAPDARDDNDQLTAGSRDPAVGNVISGDGTRFGPMSSDMADGAHVTKIAGAGGTDSSVSGGKLQVAGEHGQLTIDTDGNYRYVPKGNVPENSRDVFTYTLADSQGRVDTADLIIEFGKTQQAVRADAQQVIPGPDGVVVLPEGVQLSDIMVVGRNLVINLPDGTQMVIVDGAVFVPQLVLGGVEVPPTNLATLLIDSEPTPGVGGPPPSSGGNFEVPVPPLDPGVPLGDLIPPTEMQYTPPEIREVGGDLDRDPVITIDPGDGVPVINAVDQVSEAGLPTRNEGEPAGTGEAADGNGSDNDDPSEATTGTILYDSPDGVSSITINGVLVTGVGQVISGDFGTITITSIAAGAIGYNYVLGDNTSGDATHDDFIVTITDTDGDTATATLVVNIVDDVPIAVNDTDSIAAGQFGPATGNVITDADAGDAGDSDNGADNVGADDAHVSAVSGFGGSDNTPSGEDGELTVNGQYGVLTIHADGSYSYLRNEGTPGGVSDVFTYTLTDGDGDNASATLTINIADALPITGENATARLDDDVLGGNPGGTGDDPDGENLSGVLAASGGDGALTYAFQANGAPAGFTYQVQANGDLWVLQGSTHVLTVTLNSATGAYEVSQVAPIDHAAGGDENNVDFNITYRVTDIDGDSATGTLHVNVDDDTPEIDPVVDREAQMVVDESGPTSAAAIATPGVTKGDDPNVAGSGAIGSASSGTAIVDLNASFGADGPAAGGGISYALNVTNASSGLTLTDGSPIQLVELGNGVVVGVVQGGAFNGQAAFAISINPTTGVVTVEQYLSLDHPVNPNPNDSLGLGEGTLAVVGTATDGDGDTVSTGDVDISNLITFLDDGPSIDPALNANATVTVDESLPSGTPGIDTGGIVKGDDPDLAGGLALGQANSGSAVVNANAAFGADGPAAGGGISYALSITSGDPGLTLTDGTPIVLQMVGGVIVGVVDGGTFDGQAAFAIAIDPATGVVTVEQYLSLDHPLNPNPNDPLHIGEGAVGVTVTATDGDGDPVTSDAIDIGGQITFLDDGPTVNPTVNAQATVEVDESLPSGTPGINTGAIVKGDDPDLAGGLAIGQANSGSAIVNANAVFGADGPALQGSLSYSLSIINTASGLTLTDGTPISLQMVNGVIVGVVQGGTFNGQAAFAIAINPSTGVVTVEQYLSLDHPINPNPNDPLSFGENIVGVTVTATDGDGDPVTSDAVDIGGQITFLDDGPSANNDTDTTDPVTDQAVGNVISGAGTNEGTGNADVPGADGFGSITNLVGYNGSTDSNPAGGFDVNGQYGTLHMNVDGSYTYTRTSGPGGAVETFLYTYVDGDGDLVNATLQVTIADNTPTLNDPALIRLDDDVIPGANGNVDGPSDDDPDTVGQNVVNGQLVGSGGDGDLDYRFTGVNALPSGFSIGAGSDADTLLIVQDQGGNPVVVMTVQLNLETGDFSVTQNAPIWHPADDGGPNDNIENNSLVLIGVEVVDLDGDTDPATISINVDDDTPTINVTKGDDSNISLTTDDADTIGVATDTSSSSANFGGVFGLSQSAGADGTNAAATLAYALDVTGYAGGPGGVNSGLESHDADIFLYEIGGKVVGSTSATLAGVNAGNTIFDVSVSGSGVVTLTQYQQIDHDTADPTPTGAPYVDHVVSLVDSLVTLTASASLTDKDGDTVTDSETVNIGANLHFTDDGPQAAIVTTGANASVDETNGNQGDSNDVTGPLAVFNGVANKGTDADMAGPQFGTSASAIVASMGSSYDADGAGTTVFGLNVAPGGVDSGLDTTAGVNIYLFLENGIVVGRVGATALAAASGPAAFAVAIDPSTGVISMVEYMSIYHPNTGNADDSVSIANTAIQATVTVTDFDGDTAVSSVNIGDHIQFQDDGPFAAISVANAAISIDESAGNQVDSNDVTGPIAAFAGVANPGDDPHVAGTVIQYAQKVGAVSASGSAYGADGAGSTTYVLNVSAAGADSGLNTTDGHDILLYKEGNLIVGRVSGGADDGKAAFAIAIDPANGTLSMVEYLSIQHPNTGNPDDSVSITNGAVLAQVVVTDGDGDSTSVQAAIGNLISFQDSGPVMTAVQNMNIQNSGDVAHTAAFAYNLGADGAATNNDVITNVVGSATVGGVAVQNWTLTPVSEDANGAVYQFSFDYPIGGGATAHETGLLTFDKLAGTYTIDLASPIQGVTTILQTATGTLFQGYVPGTSTTDGSQPEISVTQIQDLAGTANDIYVQFTGVSEPSSGTGDNALEFSNWVPGAGNPAPVNGGGDTTWNAGQLFNQADGWVSTSNDSNGVNGDTIQGGEVLDFTLVQGANPTGNLASPATYAQASSMFLKFDGIGSAEDMIVVLKLYDPNTNTYTTRAVMIQNSDIIKGPGTGPGSYSGITLDQNDGLVIIESNDYNLPGENWVIVGAQIAGSDEGLAGTAIDLNGAIGVNGDSITNGAFDTQSFATDTNDGPFKISSIGFTTVQTTPQPAQLDFDVTVTDGDGDSITQHITATVTTAADSTSAATIPAANTTVAPVVLDLDSDGAEFLSQSAGVTYDYGNGLVSTAWAGADDGILVRDANGNGTVDGASEFVFGHDGLTDLQALRAAYGDTLDANDAAYANFGVWQDANSNGSVDVGEYQSLADAGITSISLVSDGVSYSAADGDVQVAGSGTYTNADGSTGSLADASFSVSGLTQEQRQLSGDSSLAIAAAVAAAGLAALPAAAQGVDHANDHADAAVVQAAGAAQNQVAGREAADDHAVAGLASGDDHASAIAAASASSSARSEGGSQNSLAGDNAQHGGSVEALVADSGPAAAADLSAAFQAAPMVNMPSAEALQAAALAGGDHGPSVVANVIADALGGGAAPTVDGLLAGLSGGGNGHAESAQWSAASASGGSVHGWDMGGDAAFMVHSDMVMKVSALALHHDAVQPTING